MVDELTELFAELSAKLLVELSKEVNIDALCGIHSVSEGECSNDIHLSLFSISSGSEGECSNNIRMYCLVYIQGRKGSARMIYIYIVWFTFGVRRGVLEWYTVGNKIG